MSSVLELVARYEVACDELKLFKRDTYKPGMPVEVDTDRYRGPGIVALDGACPPNQLPVRLGNGNVWWYPIQDCRPANGGGK